MQQLILGDLFFYFTSIFVFENAQELTSILYLMYNDVFNHRPFFVVSSQLEIKKY